MAEKGTSVHVTGNQGTAHSVYAIGIHQGTLNVNNCVDEERIRHLKDQTRKDIDIWNRGMVRVSAIETVIEKLQTRHRWVTVTGNAGDGKTTLGYMTLKSLQDDGKEVFKINTPDDYFVVLRKTPDSVVFMNDVLGVFDFDQRALSTWLHVFQIILERKTKAAEDRSCPSIIFVSRLNVLEAARNQLGKYGDVILEEDAIVNPDKLNTDKEKLDILNFHLSKHNISDIPESTKMEIYSQCPHGFPHCCEMYVELRTSGHVIDIVKFFSSPLKFLNYTTRVLIDKQECYDHFKILLKADGQLDISSISDATLRTEVQSTASSLLGSYLKMSGNGVAFSHPSIYESVAVAVGNKDPLFAAQEFPISVIMQKCKVHVPQGGANEMCIFFNESSSAMDALVQRLATEIRQGNYTVIQHELCCERKLCEQMINSSVSNTYFPFFGRAWRCIGVNRRGRTGRTLLQSAVGCCNTIAARILLERGANVNISKQATSARSILSCVVRSFFKDDPYALFRLLAYGETILHEACKNREVDVDLLRMLIDHGANVSKANENGETALHVLCQRESEDQGGILEGWTDATKDTRVFKADSWEILVDYLCEKNGIDKEELEATRRSLEEGQQGTETEEMKAITLLIRNGLDVTKTDNYGQTPLHLLCQRSRVDVRTVHLLIQNGTDVNLADRAGNTPVHYICKRSKTDISTVYLLTEPRADNTLKNVQRYTALQYLCQWHKVRLATASLP
ncbi:uncharacterized protein LOC124259523 [Haliotis rubra]|uniref:uncharacterized protein LOC124259523 n=1 Tax=Haliotis rubra TaxID=36100 RepID=UPI001EE569FE|nr:uncharacterized protein LOC124259523 [Haliotis rubra]